MLSKMARFRPFLRLSNIRVCVIFFIRSSIDGHVGCFCISAIAIRSGRSSLVAQWVKVPALSLWWLGLLPWYGYSPWPQNFRMPHV